MTRRISRIPVLSTVSSLLLIGVLVLWARSPRRADVFLFYTPAGHLTGIASGELGLLVAVTGVPFGDRFALSADVLTGARGEFTSAIQSPLFNPAQQQWHLLGFRWARGTFGPTGWRFGALVVPYWAVLVALAILPLNAVRRLRIERRRRRLGTCVGCGGTSGGSPGRCPTCGRTAADGREVSARVRTARLASWPLLALMLAALLGAILRGRRAARTEVHEPKTVLDRRVPEIELDNVSLESAAGRLGKQCGARIEMTRAVASTAADPWVPLTLPLHLRLRNVSVTTMLRVLADAASVRNLDLTYAPCPDGSILLEDRSAAPRILRVYDLGDLPYPTDSPQCAPISAALRPRTAVYPWSVPRPGDSRLVWIGSRLAAFATWREQAQIAATLRALRGADAEAGARTAMLTAIDKQVGPIEVRDMPLAEVIDRLGGQAGVNLVVNWSALDPSHHWAQRNTPITTHITEQPLRAALEKLCRAPGESMHLTYVVDDNVLIVTAAEQFP